MKKIFVFLTVLFIAPLTVNAYQINSDFDNDKCEFTVTGTQDGHDANVNIFLSSNKELKGMQTGTIENGNFSVTFVLKFEQDTEVDIVVANEAGENKSEKLNELVPACDIVHTNNNNNEQPGGQPEVHKVRFITDGGTPINDVDVPHEDLVQRPEQNPEKDGFTFGGWYEDQGLTIQFDFNRGIIDDTDIYAKWIDNNNVQEYVFDDDKGNVISFLDEVGRRFVFSIVDMLSIPKEDIVASDPEMTSELYDMVVNNIRKTSEAKGGKLISILQIEVIDLDVTNPNDPNYYYTNGPFTIKLKITDEMKKYDSFQLAYINDSFTAVDFIDMTIEGDYAVCTLPHLSVYSLIGNTTPESPKTNDNIMNFVGILAVSIVGLSVGVLTIKKIKKSK